MATRVAIPALPFDVSRGRHRTAAHERFVAVHLPGTRLGAAPSEPRGGDRPPHSAGMILAVRRPAGRDRSGVVEPAAGAGTGGSSTPDEAPTVAGHRVSAEGRAMHRTAPQGGRECLAC